MLLFFFFLFSLSSSPSSSSSSSSSSSGNFFAISFANFVFNILYSYPVIIYDYLGLSRWIDTPDWWCLLGHRSPPCALLYPLCSGACGAAFTYAWWCMCTRARQQRPILVTHRMQCGCERILDTLRYICKYAASMISLDPQLVYRR